MSPRLSVIVPVWRHWHLLPGLLDCLAAQDPVPGGFEVLVVNNEAPAPPPAGLTLPGFARLVEGPAPGAYAARNAGAAAARGAWLVFTDADCRPDPGWLAAFAAEAGRGAAGLLAGPVRVDLPPDPGPFAIYDRVRGIPQARYVARGYAATANLAVPAPLFHAAGGFDAARFSGGDAEFCRRLGRKGTGIRLVPEAGMTHVSRTDWEALATKARRIKGGQIRAGSRRRRLAWSLRSLAPPLRDTRAYLASAHPLDHRLIAVRVRFRLWGVELAEMLRLWAGKPPERG